MPMIQHFEGVPEILLTDNAKPLVDRRKAGGRIDVDTNRYSVPPQFIGATLEVTIEADTLQAFCQDRVIAEHVIHPGRHQVVEDPGHAISFHDGLAKVGKPSEIRRPLSHYAAIVGGEAW